MLLKGFDIILAVFVLHVVSELQSVALLVLPRSAVAADIPVWRPTLLPMMVTDEDPVPALLTRPMLETTTAFAVNINDIDPTEFAVNTT